MGGNPTRSFAIYLELLISLSYYLPYDDMKLSESSEFKRELTVPCALIFWNALSSVTMVHINQDRPLPVTFSMSCHAVLSGMAGDSEL